MRNKIFTRIIITTLLCAFLTFNVGKVTRVSAVGTTAAIAGTAFILTGAVYLSYIALTNGQVAMPIADDMHEWLGTIGRKVTQYPSGSEAYQDIYQGLLRDPTANVIDGVWTWTQDRLKSFANDFSDTRLIQNIVSYEQLVNTFDEIGTQFDYPYPVEPTPNTVRYNGNLISLEAFQALGFSLDLSQNQTLYRRFGIRNQAYITGTNLSTPVRNVKTSTNKYYGQTLINGVWSSPRVNYGIRVYDSNGNFTGTLLQVVDIDILDYSVSAYQYALDTRSDYPPFSKADIYDETTGEVIPAEVITPVETVKTPRWIDPDNDNRPIIPWVPIPQLPANVPTPSGYNGVSQWGFNLQDLLDKLEDLAGQLIDLGSIAALINEFAGLHGDNYYLEYNDGDTNYYTYYQPTIFDNDTEYVTYNINISEQEEVIPVDLNTISLYTDNRYLDQIKQSAINGSSMLRDLAVFWHDVDPEVTYIVFGCCILILIGAFTGKLGHS